MARVAANAFLLKGLRGHIGKEIVFKKYGNKTVVTRYPDMSNVKPSVRRKLVFTKITSFAFKFLLNKFIAAFWF